VSQQKVAGHLRSAKNNSTITEALIKKGDNPPRWFAGAEQLLQRSSTAQVPVNNAQTEEAHTSLPSIQAVATRDRSAALSARSVPPAYVYRLAQPVYQPPPNPILEEASQLFQETIREGMRDSLNRARARAQPMTIEEITAIAEAYNIKHQIESQNTARMMFMMNLMQSAHAKPPDMEETKELFTKPFKELTKAARSEYTVWSKTIKAIGQQLQNCVPDIGPTDDIIKELMAANDKRRKNDQEALISIAELYMENRRRKNFDLEMMKYQNKKIFDNIWKNSFKP